MKIIQSFHMLLVVVIALFSKGISVVSYPSQVMMEIPLGSLVNKFDPQAYCLNSATNFCPFMNNQSFHCFSDFDGTGRPTYVRGMAQGYWYYSGPIAAAGNVSVLSIYANNPTYKEYPLVGTMRIKYASDFLSATNILVTCQPSSWCALWPTQLINGKSLNPSVYPTEINCLYDIGETPGTYSAMLSKWTSAQGSNWVCAAPTPTESMAINGSWLYVLSNPECLIFDEAYPCLNNSGPYFNGLTATLPNDAGILLTQWSAWTYAGQGRSIYAVPSAGNIAGSYCVYDDARNMISVCFPEVYNIVGSSTAAECDAFVNGPLYPSKKKIHNNIVLGLALGLTFGVLILFCIWRWFYLRNQKMLKSDISSVNPSIASVNPMIHRIDTN
jgi:hypothetical protein